MEFAIPILIGVIAAVVFAVWARGRPSRRSDVDTISRRPDLPPSGQRPGVVEDPAPGSRGDRARKGQP